MGRKGQIPANKGKVTVRKCEYCSVESARVNLYKKWNKLLCGKHYWHMYKFGKILWGDERPLLTPKKRRERYIKSMVEWKKAVFERDNYTCQICKTRGVKLEADHIKPYEYFPELRLELSNGRTLCVPCHRQTPTWGRRGQKIYANKRSNT